MIQEIKWAKLVLSDLSAVKHLVSHGIAKDACMDGDKKVLRVWY